MKDYSQYKLAAKRDYRDYVNRDILKVAKPVPLPEKARTRYFSPIIDQKNRNSCTGHAGEWFWHQVLHSRGMAVDVPLSALFPWFYARRLEGVEDKDEGVQLRSMMEALHEYGICVETLWPESSPLSEPSFMATAYGAALKLPEAQRCETINEIRYSIAAEDQSVCIGIPVFQNWYDPKVARTGEIPYTGSGVPLGGHALVVCGYDDNRVIAGNEPGVFTVANSWGTDFGDNGFVYLPYDYFAEQFDAWTSNFLALPDPV